MSTMLPVYIQGRGLFTLKYRVKRTYYMKIPCSLPQKLLVFEQNNLGERDKYVIKP